MRPARWQSSMRATSMRLCECQRTLFKCLIVGILWAWLRPRGLRAELKAVLQLSMLLAQLLVDSPSVPDFMGRAEGRRSGSLCQDAGPTGAASR